MKTYVLIFVLIIASCKAKDPNTEVRNDLKNTMQKFLYNSINNDSSNVKYQVKDVIYFEDKDKYICEFTVHLRAKLFDTTGIMKAFISKDFKTVKRLY